MDLKIQDVRLIDRPGSWDVAITDGYISDIAPSIATPATLTLNGDRCLLIPGLVDAHFHLDKALLLERQPAQTGNFAEAMEQTLQLKQAFTVTDIQMRARRILETAIAFGTTAMRSHVEVDPIAKLKGMEAIVPLRDEYAWGMTLQLAVFAQEGITNQPATLELLRSAMQMGGDAIGSAPYVDPDPERNVQIIFDIAEEFNCDVDFHLDFLDDDQPLLLPFVIEETVRRGWQGRVCLGHVTKLSSLTPGDLETIAHSIRAADIALLTLPASDLYMMARRDTHNVRRGVAPAHRLAELGVTVGLATNNVQNLFTPFGDGDVLKICTLLSQVLHLGTTASHQHCLEMATTQAARAIGIADYGVAVGNIADLVLIEAASVSEIVGACPPNRTVIKRGRPIAVSKLEQQLGNLSPVG